MKTVAHKIFMLIAAASFFLLPQLSHALTITGVDVDIPLNAANGGGTRNYSIWDGQIGAGVILTAGQQLILTQNSGYNFDTSEDQADRAVAASRHIVTINGLSFTDTTGVLLGLPRGVDPENAVFNETQDWVLIGTVAGEFQLFVGYADNAHTGPCLDADSNCFPNPLNGIWPNGQPGNPAQPGIFFFGAGGTGGCDRAGANPCYDAGALRIVALDTPTVPEPAAIILLALGLAVFSVVNFRRANDPGM